jgi:hypothetical protein
MPEELVIILVVVIGAIWLLVKVGQGIAALVDQATKNYDAATARRKDNRYSKKRDNLRRYVHTVIPNELDSFEKKFEVMHTQFEQAQRLTNWVARPLEWRKEQFQVFTPSRKHSSHGEMCIEDINAILSPDSELSTWLHKESEILSRQCRYPSEPPAGNLDKFATFPTMSADLKAAIFEIDAAHIGKKDVDRYFADEQIKALTYNNRRADLIARTATLNSAIEEWNRKSRISWDAYVPVRSG